jgi:hypothetical protein
VPFQQYRTLNERTLTVKLDSSSGVLYPKFKTVGDVVTGDYIKYEEGVPGKFGPENRLTLQGERGKLIVRTPTNLSRTLRENLPTLPGKRLTIRFASEAPSKKGYPVKVFTVDAEEVQPAAPVEYSGEAASQKSNPAEVCQVQAEDARPGDLAPSLQPPQSRHRVKGFGMPRYVATEWEQE